MLKFNNIKTDILIIKEHNCYYKELLYVIDIYNELYVLVYKNTKKFKKINYFTIVINC
jgi:hypothetical protein